MLRDSVLTFTLVVNDGTKDSDPDIVKGTVINLDVLSTETNIDSVYMAVLDSVDIDTINAEVTLYAPYGLDVRSLAPELILSSGASVNPPSKSTHDFSMPVYYTVTAEDGITSRMWKFDVYRPELNMQRTLASGWNWISLNVQPASSDINSLFSGLSLSEQDYLKSPAYSSVYYTATGWFGNLSAFPQNKMVKFKKSVAENLTVQGLQINPTINQIPLLEGWNDVAYLLRSDASLNDAIVTSSLPAGDIVIKGENGSSIWYPASGWSGELDSLHILHGYKMNVQKSGTLAYNPPASARKNTSVESSSRRELLREYHFHPEMYASSATMIAEAIAKDGKNITREGDLLLAYHDSELRGIARSVYVPSMAKFVFVLTCYLKEQDESFTFNLKPASDKKLYPAHLTLNLQPDAIAGESYHPLQLSIDLQGLNRDDQTSHQLSVYPNPVADRLNISSTDPVLEVRLYDLTGKVLLHQKVTGYTPEVNLSHLDPGIYTLKAETADRVFIRKVIKTAY